MSTFGVPATSPNFTSVIDDMTVFASVRGTNGSTSVIHTKSNCKTHNCWFNSGKTIIPVDTDGVIGEVLVSTCPSICI